MQLMLNSHQQEYLLRYQRNKAHGSFTGEEKEGKKIRKSQTKTQKMAQQANTSQLNAKPSCPAHTQLSAASMTWRLRSSNHDSSAPPLSSTGANRRTLDSAVPNGPGRDSLISSVIPPRLSTLTVLLTSGWRRNATMSPPGSKTPAHTGSG